MRHLRAALVVAIALALVLGPEARATDTVTIATASGGSAHMSRNGEWLLYTHESGSLHRRNLRTGDDDNIGGYGRLIADDGDITCFDTASRLLKSDRDRTPDVYCRRISSGSLRLITTGSGKFILLDIDASGRTIVFGRARGFGEVQPFMFDWFFGTTRGIGPTSTRLFVFGNPLLFPAGGSTIGDPAATSVIGFEDVADLSNDGRRFLFSTLNRKTLLYERETRKVKELPGIGALSGDGTVGLALTGDGLRRIDLATGTWTDQPVPSPPRGYDIFIRPSSDGRFVVLTGSLSPASFGDEPPNTLPESNYLYRLDALTGDVSDLRDSDRNQIGELAQLSSDGATVMSANYFDVRIRKL